MNDAPAPTLSLLPGLLSDLEALYTDIHAHPELSMQETRTSALAADRLRAAGYEVTTGIGKIGVVGLLRNGEGPVVMLRADMDALPVEEATGLPAMKCSSPDSNYRLAGFQRLQEKASAGSSAFRTTFARTQNAGLRVSHRPRLALRQVRTAHEKQITKAWGTAGSRPR
jgi:hypothetical protein